MLLEPVAVVPRGYRTGGRRYCAMRRVLSLQWASRLQPQTDFGIAGVGLSR
jgi:hypothetical protein